MDAAAVMTTGAYGCWVEFSGVADTSGNRNGNEQDQYNVKRTRDPRLDEAELGNAKHHGITLPFEVFSSFASATDVLNQKNEKELLFYDALLPGYSTIHDKIVVLGFHQNNGFLITTLVHTCSCSQLKLSSDAQKLFDTVPPRSQVTWFFMVSMTIKHSFNIAVLVLFCQFRRHYSTNPNEFIFSSVIKAGTQLGGLNHAFQIHGLVVRNDFVQHGYVGTYLAAHYAKHGCGDEANFPLDGLESKIAITWTSISSWYSQQERNAVSLNVFNRIKDGDICQAKFVFSGMWSACLMLEILVGKKHVHGCAVWRDIDKAISMINAIIACNFKCHTVESGGKLLVLIMCFILSMPYGKVDIAQGVYVNAADGMHTVEIFDCGHMGSTYALHFAMIVLNFVLLDLTASPLYVEEELILGAIKMVGSILTASHAACYKSAVPLFTCINGTVTSLSAYVAFLDDTTLKSSKYRSEFPISYSWLVEGNYITWTTHSEGSKFLAIKILGDTSTGIQLHVGAALRANAVLPPLFATAEFHFIFQDEQGFSAAMHINMKGQVESFPLLGYVGANAKWDPGGNDYYFHTNGSLQFKQWDPSGCSFVYWEDPLDLEATCPDATINQQHCPYFNLEDKVDF